MSKPDMKRKSRKFLDGEKLFRYYWSEMGTARSYDGVVRWCAANGIVNPYTRIPPNRMSIFKSMWRWAVLKENFEMSYEIVNNAQRDEGNFMTKEEYKEFLFEKVYSAYQHEKKYVGRFLKRNGYTIGEMG